VAMAGNVREWTSTVKVDEKKRGRQTAIVRGGSFFDKDVALAKRREVPIISKLEIVGELGATELAVLGFRCASDAPPPGAVVEGKK
jgi:formylglycine-generating enzyme required for sulfatase activity